MTAPSKTMLAQDLANRMPVNFPHWMGADLRHRDHCLDAVPHHGDLADADDGGHDGRGDGRDTHGGQSQGVHRMLKSLIIIRAADPRPNGVDSVFPIA